MRIECAAPTQAIGPDGDGGFLAVLGEQVAIDFLVAGFEEDGFAAIAALRDVVWTPGDDDAGETGHRKDIPPSARLA